MGWRVHQNRAAINKLAETAQVARVRAEQGDADAEVTLGSLYYHGQGVPQDYREALRWFQKSADQDYASGQYHVGVMHYYGNAVPQDYREAIRLYRQAADQDYPTAQDQLGTMYAHGIGLPQDYVEAFSWYRKAADLGYARGEEHLGTMYYFGHGTTQDYIEAAFWYRKAADQGNPGAQYDLAAMCHFGQGVQPSSVETRRWLRKAAVQGDEKALRAITFGLSTPAKIALRTKLALGIVFGLSFLRLRTFRQKVTTAAGALILFSVGYDWYGYTHSRILNPIYGVDVFSAFYWLLQAAAIASMVYIVRLGKEPGAEGSLDNSQDGRECLPNHFRNQDSHFSLLQHVDHLPHTEPSLPHAEPASSLGENWSKAKISLDPGITGPISSAHHDLRVLTNLHRVTILFALITAVAAPLWHLHVMNREMPSSHSDLLLVMTGVRATLNGLNPYSDQVTQKIQIAYYGRLLVPSDHAQKMAFAYPAHAAVVLAPLSLLSWDRLRRVFLLLVPILMGATVPLWLRVLAIRVKHSHLVITTILFLASWPMMWSLRLQQPTLIVAALLAAGCFMLKRRWDVGAGAFFALCTIKPQLVGPLLIWLLLWTTLQRRWRFLVSLIASTLLLLLCAEWIAPGWLPRWPVALADYAQYTQLRPDLQALFGRWVALAVTIAIMAACSSILWRLRRCNGDSPGFGIAISLALAATVSLLPTQPGMIYNQVFLLPAFLILIYRRATEYYPALARRISVILLGCSFAATILAVLVETIGRPSTFCDSLPFQNLLLPTVAVTALMMMTGFRRDSIEVLAPIQLEGSPSVSDLNLTD